MLRSFARTFASSGIFLLFPLFVQAQALSFSVGTATAAPGQKSRSKRNVVSETPVAAGVVETGNRRFKELWENRSLVFPQLRQFPQCFSWPKFGLRC
jgi:hypothetical protein